MPIYRFVLAVALLVAAWAEAQEPHTADDPAAAMHIHGSLRPMT